MFLSGDRVDRKERGRADLVALAGQANYSHENESTSKLSEVSAFTTAAQTNRVGKRYVATPRLLLSLKRRRLGRPSPHRRMGQPFRANLIGWRYSAGEAETTWDFTGMSKVPFSPGDAATYPSSRRE